MKVRESSYCSADVSGETHKKRGVSQAGKHLIVLKQKTFFIEVES